MYVYATMYAHTHTHKTNPHKHTHTVIFTLKLHISLGSIIFLPARQGRHVYISLGRRVFCVRRGEAGETREGRGGRGKGRG